jgi:hypothetical protein
VEIVVTATMLYCGSCGKRCGVAHLGDERHRIDDGDRYVVLDTRVNVGEVPDPEVRGGWTDTRGDFLYVLGHLDRAGDWPTRPWRCPLCAAWVRLDWDQARRVGQVSRLLAANVSGDK